MLRNAPSALADAREMLDTYYYTDIDESIVDAATGEPDHGLGSLDAIHLASARRLTPDLTGLLTYDRRLGAAAESAGIAVLAPGHS